MILITILLIVVALISWVAGAFFAHESVRNCDFTDTLFALPIIPTLFKPRHKYYAKPMTISVIAYVICIMSIIALFTI